MEFNNNQPLYQSSKNIDSRLLHSTDDKHLLCCCISYKWCFDHSGIAITKQYSDNEYNCCTCLDCCTWCLECQTKKCSICIKQTNLYLCCCSIYFI